MLSRFSQFFAKTTPLTLSLWLFLLVFGYLAYTSWMPREGFPAVEVPIATAGGEFISDDPSQVLMPQEVDEQIAPLVEAISEREEVKSIESAARPNSFTLIAELEEGFTTEDAAEILSEEYAKVEGDFENLNFRASPLNLALLLGKYDLLVGVRSVENVGSAELEAQAEKTLQFYEDQPEIELAEVYPLSISQELPNGEQATRDISYSLLTSSTSESLEFTSAASIGVVAADGVDSIELKRAADRALSQIEEANVVERGFESFVAFDYAPQIETEIGSLQSNFITGIIGVALVALVLITWRASVIAAVFIMTVMATSVGMIHLAGITLNTISLFGIVLALGLFVDDAIVITESIYNNRREGRGYLETVGIAIRRVGKASVSGTLTTILVFAPMLAISGILGKFIRILPISVMIALAVSLVLSLVFIPFAARFLIVGAPDKPGMTERIQDKLANSLAAGIGSDKHRKRNAFIGIAAGVGFTLAGLAVLAPRVPFNIFPPQSDSIDMSVSISEFTDAETIEDVNALVTEITQAAADALGDNLVSGYVYEGNERSALGSLRLTEIGTRDTAPELIKEFLVPIEDEYFGTARVDFEVISAGPPEDPFPFKMQVFSEDADVRLDASTAILAELDGLSVNEGTPTEFAVVEARTSTLEFVNRTAGEAYVQIEARFDGDNVTTVTTDTESYLSEWLDADKLDELGLESDAVTYDFGFESDNQDSFNSMPAAFGMALLAMLFLLIFLFRSISQWLLVFLAIPFSFFGVFASLLMFDNALSFFVMIGFLSLMGIAVNNSILLIDFANQERENGATAVEAIREATRQRFRPLVATTCTTVVGLLPLALSDPFWEPLSYTIIFGLISSTVLVLISLPYFYLILESVRDKVNTPWRRKVKTVEASS